MYELTRYTYSRHEVNTLACEDRHQKSDKAISFDQQKGHYNVESSDLNLDYWFEMSDKIVSEDVLSHSWEEAMMEYGTDNWSSDDEETLQVHPETIPSLASEENWGYCHDNSVTHNHRPLDTAEDDVTVSDHPMV